MAFPTSLPADSPFSSVQYSSSPPASAVPSTPLQGLAPPPSSSFDPYAPTPQPSLLQSTPPYGSVGGGTFSSAAPAAPYSYSTPPTASPYIAPAPASPFATTTPGPLGGPFGGLFGPAYVQPLPNGTYPPRVRMLQQFHLDSTYLARIGSRGLGITDVNLDGVFAVPVRSLATPVFLTPGFTYHSWNGPSSGAFAGSPDLPPNAYDAYLESAWRPQVTSWFSVDLAVRVGVYSDFHFIDSQSLRILGRGVGLVRLSERWQVAAGIWYLDRLTVKLLPAGGVIWTPNADTKFALLFPNPKLSQRLTTIGNTDLWVYLAGQYGGGKWTVRRASGAGDVVELNDLRALLGMEWFRLGGATGYGEVGYVFDRHIIYRSGTPTAHPGDTVLLRAGLTY